MRVPIIDVSHHHWYELESSSKWTMTHAGRRVKHSFCPRLALIARTTDDFRPSKLILARLGTFVTHSWTIEHLVEGQLFDHLCPSIWGYFELLNIFFAISLIMQYLFSTRYSESSCREERELTCLHVVLGDKLVEGLLCILDIATSLPIQGERQLLRRL